MQKRGLWSLARILAGALLVIILAGPPRAHAEDTIESVSTKITELVRQGKLAEAGELVEKIAAIAEKQQGADSPGFAASLQGLAGLYRTLQRLPDSERLLARAVAIREKAPDPDDAALASALSDLVEVQSSLGRHAEAEPHVLRLLAIQEKRHGADHPDLAAALHKYGSVSFFLGRYPEARTAFEQALAIREKALGRDDPLVAETLHSLAYVYQNESRYAEAEAIALRGLAIRRKALGEESREVSNSLNSLAQIQLLLGRYPEAEANFRRSLAIGEKQYGAEAREVAVALGNLAMVYQMQQRIEEAARLLERAIVILEKVLGPDHSEIGVAINNLAIIYDSLRRYDEAAQYFRKGIPILEKTLGPEHPNVAVALGNLGTVTINAGRAQEAEPYLVRALAIIEKTLGKDHVNTAKALNNLAHAYEEQGRITEGKPLLERSLAILLQALGPEHPDVGTAYDNLGAYHFAIDDPVSAANHWRQSADIFVKRTRRGGDVPSQSYMLHGLIKALYQLPSDGGTANSVTETFEWAQWATGSEAAESLAQMAARGAKGDPALSQLARERQDLVGEWRQRDRALIEMVSLEADKRQAQAEAGLRDRLAAIDARIAEIDKRLAAEFPDYASLASAAPAPLAEVQAFLRPDEALVLFLDTAERKPVPEETFVWAITKDAARWARVPMGTLALTDAVKTLRCGLDAVAWQGEASDCPQRTGVSAAQAGVLFGRPPPFPHERAHQLYKALFAGVEDLIDGKQLLLVPSGPLTQLPFQVLIKSPPSGNDNRRADWLARHHGLTVLPAVSSLKALRRTTRTSSAPKPMIGFGNPLLDGPDGRYASLARASRELQSCAMPPRSDEAPAGTETVSRAVISSGMGHGLIKPANIRRQPPLPETAMELCAVAEDLKVDAADIHLGAGATEREVKALNDTGGLAQYRIVHFATHAAMAGELAGANEPGLLLTPPAEASEADDGYLSSTDVAALKLDADWVILSACNTAAGNARDAEALSGLARAFIYAQARALLVSHWAVDSRTTVKLVTAALREMSRDPGVGRAEALRRSMLSLIATGATAEAHPAMWAPFIVVGEGRR
jgi:CHAT domain-containing protein/tetratricopeptide (TPR) repeat protein